MVLNTFEKMHTGLVKNNNLNWLKDNEFTTFVWVILLPLSSQLIRPEKVPKDSNTVAKAQSASAPVGEVSGKEKVLQTAKEQPV